MRPLYFIFVLSLYSSSSYAADIETQINKACLRHAVSLVAQLKADVINNLTQAQTDQSLKIATDTCQAYFRKEFSPEKIAENVDVQKEVIEKKSRGDRWFETGDKKKGNERLTRKR